MIFKYQTELGQLSVKCPPETCKPVNIAAFRWVFERLKDERNFQPLYFRNPQRVNDFGDAEKCQALGLSMFDSAENAVRQFDFLKTRLGETAYQVLGTKLASGKLTPSDGAASEPDKKGHFTFHPSETCTFEDGFQIIAAL
jgi:hypothetical protein